MQIRTELALQAVLKSLTEVIAPAIDRGDKMAQEQIGLVVGLLTLISTRLPDAFAYDCDELARLIELAKQIAPAAGSDELEAAVERGAGTWERALVSPADLTAAIEDLRGVIGNAASRLPSRTDASARDATRAVLRAASEQLLRERSWVLMQGWESEPATVPDLEALLAPTAGRGPTA